MSLLGVNLSGAEFGGISGKYGYNYTYPTHAEVDYYASKNLNVIRLPFRWERLQPTLGGALDSAEIGRIKDIVAYAASKGMSVILDPHDFGGYNGNLIGSAAVPNSAFADFWGKLSATFSASSNVIFGLMNEPNVQSAATWLQSANAAIAAIRGAGATQEILVPGTHWTGGSTWTTSDNASVMGPGIVDPLHNYAIEIHEYLDAYASGTQPTVVSTSIGVDRLTAVTQWAEKNGVKLFLGEFGVGQDATSLAAMKNMLTYMSAHSDAWQGATYWGAGPWWGNYMYSIEPTKGVDKPQMGVLEGFAPAPADTTGSIAGGAGQPTGVGASGSTTSQPSQPATTSLPTEKPAITVSLASDTGRSGTDHVTNTAILTGHGDANAVVHFTIDGVASASTAQADANGDWSFAPEGLKDGKHAILVSEANAVGRAVKAIGLTLMTSAPDVSINDPGRVFGSAVQTITGTGKAGSVVKVTGEAGSIGGYATVAADGTWSRSVKLAGFGAEVFTAQATDAAGNVGNAAAVTYTLAHGPVITSGGGGMVGVYDVSAGTTQIATVKAVDADTRNHVTYALLDATGKAAAQTTGFAIDAATGALSFTTEAAAGLHSVTAMAVDRLGATTLQTIKVNVGGPTTVSASSDTPGLGQTFVANTLDDLLVQGFRATGTLLGQLNDAHSLLALGHSLFNGAYAGEQGRDAVALMSAHSVQSGADTLINTDRGTAITLQNVDRTTLLAHATDFAFT